MRVLIIDDSRAMRKILGKIFRELGFEIFEAGHGLEALERLKNMEIPNLILVDWNMPKMNGYEFVCCLRSNHHEYDDVPLMMVTTETEMNQMIKAIEAGANEYLMKPFTKESIVDKLEILNLTQTN